MPARATLLVVLALSLMASAPAAAGDTAPPPSSPPERLRALLESKVRPGSPEPSGSPRYLALRDAGTRGTRLFVGWILPDLPRAERDAVPELVGRVESALSDLRAHTAWISDARVFLGGDVETPLLGVEIGAKRAGAARELETALLGSLAALAGAEPGLPADPAAASPTGATRSLARRLAPLARGVVELCGPGAPSPVRPKKPARHVIESGDTLSEIALENGLDLDELLRLNGLDPDRPIHPGEELELTSRAPPRPKLYVARSGDTLAKVAKHFGVTQKALVDVNRLRVRTLSPGQKLVLPR